MNVLKPLLGLTLAALPVAAAQSGPQTYVSGFVPYSSGFNVYSLCPHVLAQFETRLGPRTMFVAEGSLGYAFMPGGSGVVSHGVRLGLNFR